MQRGKSMARHGSIADQLAPLKTYVTEPDHEPEPLQTNWSTVAAANDNNPEDIEGMKIDKLWDISPSTGEIHDQVTKNEPERNDAGLIVKWGSLRFSDGGQTEQGYKLTIDGKVVIHQFVVPAGGMLGTTDKERNQRGGDENPEDVSGSMEYFSGKATPFRPAGLFIAQRANTHKRIKRQERIGPKTKTEERKWLEDAIANTPVMPEVTKYPDGFPASPANLAQLFPGMVKVCTGDSGSQSWTDLATLRENRKEWFEWVDSLSPQDRETLAAARTAKTFADLAPGLPRRTAFRKGRLALIAANDNLMAAANRHASGSA